MNVDALLEESKQTFSEISQSLPDGRPDKAAVVKGATQAATVCVSFEGAFSEALDLVRLFCSVHVVGLKAVALVIDAESDKIWRSELNDRGSESDRAVRLLRVLISSLNSFLSKGRSSVHSSGKHLDVLDGTVAVMRRTIDNLAGEFMDTTVGKAAARLRGLTAMACFGRRRSSRHDQAKETKWNENLVRMGTRDVEKLLKCLSRQGKKDQASSYLRNPGNCVEALGALRRIATAVPEVYPKIVTAFADAVKCMDRASEGEWGHRPSLKNGAVRHTLVACSAHLADRVGRAPDDARREAFSALCAALSDCCIMQTGGYVPVITPPPYSAAGMALREKASANRKPVHPSDSRDAKIAKVDHRGKTKTVPISPRTGAGASGTPAEASMIPVDVKNTSISPRAGEGASGTPAKASTIPIDVRKTSILPRSGAGVNGTPEKSSMIPVDVRNTSISPRSASGTNGALAEASRTPEEKKHASISRQSGAGASGTPAKASMIPVHVRNASISPRAGAGASGTPAKASRTPEEKKHASISQQSGAGVNGTPTEALMTPVNKKNTRSEAVVAAPTAEVVFPAEARSTGARDRPCTSPTKSADKCQTPVVAAPTPASAPAPPKIRASASVPTCSQGNQPSSNSLYCNPAIETATPTAMPPVSVTAVSPTTEDNRREKKGLAAVMAPSASQALAAPPEKKSVQPSTETKPHGGDGDGDSDSSVGWKEGERYNVVLGQSFYRDAGGKEDDGSGRYVHLKYDFMPGRTNLDAPATLRQGPLTGADGQTNNHGQQRWAAEMVYESRDPENPRPVRFDGDAARAQDVECVLVFDGSTFTMERVSVIGGLKNVQEFNGPAVRSAGGATLEASMARRKKKEGRPKKDPKDEQQKQQQQQQKKRKVTVEGEGKEKSACSGAEAGAGDKDEKNNNGGSGTAIIKKKARKEKKADTGITINPANMLSQPKGRQTGGEPSTPNGDSDNANGPNWGMGMVGGGSGTT